MQALNEVKPSLTKEQQQVYERENRRLQGLIV